MPPWIYDKHKMEMRVQLVCVGKDTFFPNGVQSHLFVAFSPNTADCTVLKKNVAMLEKAAHQPAASNNSRSCYWFCMGDAKKIRGEIILLHSVFSLGNMSHKSMFQ